MNEGRYLHQINEHNPLNINIQFNINSRLQGDHPQLINKRINLDPTQLKQNSYPYHSARTPDLAHTDRNTYNKDNEYLQPMDYPRRKKKSKRNSMDINIPSRTNNQEYFHKNKQKGLNQAQMLKATKKKRSFSKCEGEIFKKGLWEGASKSAAIEIRSDRKGYFNHSLKNIIHKIVNSQLSKRSLVTSFNKGRSPYHLQAPQNAGNLTNRKRQKKKNLSCKSERDIKADEHMQQTGIVEKLNSLKSMTASILRSQIQEPEIPYYSKKKAIIHIQTDHSIDLLEEIAYYEKKGGREERRREHSNPLAFQDTTQLIQTYIQLLGNQLSYRKQSEDQILQQQLNVPENENEKIHQSKYKGDTISKEMENLFEQEKRQSEGHQEKTLMNKRFVEENLENKQVNAPQEKMRPFLSSQIERGGRNGQFQRLKLQELKKQEIEKWGYLLQFIRRKMGSQEADTQTVLNQVYLFLQRSKNYLQRDLAQDIPAQMPQSKELDEQFTVKYSQKHEEAPSHKDSYFESPIKLEEQDEDVASFREEYTTEENQDMKLLNLETISSALKQRKQSLLIKKDKELNALQHQKQNSKLSEVEYEKEKEKIQKWIKRQLEEISKARKSIWRGYREARGILDKTIHSRQYEEQSSAGKMMKCLSQTYLRKPVTNYAQALRPQQPRSSQEDQSSQRSSSMYSLQSKSKSSKKHNKKSDQHKSEQSENMGYNDDFEQEQHSEENFHPSPVSEPLGGSQQLSLQKSEQMEAIKERLLKMKRQHFAGQDSNDNINYEQVEKELQDGYSDEEIAIINREIGGPAKKLNNLQVKLKYCCPQDKEDIFQFIFLDLCIELYQQPCSDNRIMKLINNFVSRAQAQAKKKKGVKTNLNVVKEYLKRFTNFLLRTSKVSLNNISLPMGPTALEMLRYMHDGDYQVKDEQEEAPTIIIPITVFQKFQQSLLPTLEFQPYYDDSEKEQARVNFLKTILHIHNKALFDSLNQFLDHQRPFGIWGTPFPWEKAASFPHAFTETKLEQKLKKSSQKVIEQCSYVCGLLADKQQSLVGNVKISDAYIDQIRQDRLSRMLANELVESEQRWLFYDDQETQVLVELGNFVWSFLLQQVKSQFPSLYRS